MRTVSLSPSVFGINQESVLIEHLVLEHVSLLRIHALTDFHWHCTDTNTIDLVFLVQGELSATFNHDQVMLSSRYLLLKNTHENLAMHCQADSKLLLLSVPVMTFRKYLLDYFKLAPFKAVVFERVVDSHSSVIKPLVHLFKQLDEGMSAVDSLMNRGLISGLLEGQILLTIMDSLRWSYTADIQGRVNELKPRCVKKAIDYVIEHEKKKINIQDLALAAGVGLRTLQMSFQQIYGISPMCYVRRYKLKKIREYLLSHYAHDVSIGDIAAQWSFMHPSSFAKNYYAFFGEYPSETVKNSK